MELKERMNLTDVENTYLSYERSSPSNVTAVAHFEGIYNTDMVVNALNIAKESHPYLQYFIDQEEGRSVFIYDPVKPVPLTIFQEAEEDLWIKICEEEMNGCIDNRNAPMMKAFLLRREKRSSELIISFSHIIADGVNAVQFIRDVIYLLGKITEGEKTPTIDNHQLLRPDTIYFSQAEPTKPLMNIDRFEKDNFIVQSFLPDSEPADVNFSYILGSSGKRSKLLPFHLSSEESSKIINHCREKGITVNTFLSIALIFAMRDHIYEKGIVESPLWVKISTAVDLRRRLQNIQISPSDFGMWAGRCILYSKIGEETIKYNFSHSFHSIFSEYLQRYPFYYSNLMIQQINKLQHSTTVREPVQFFPHVKITNLGDLNKMGIPIIYGKIKVNKIGFVAPQHRDWINDLGFGLCASGFDKKLILNFIYMEPARTEEEARVFISRFFYHLNQ